MQRTVDELRVASTMLRGFTYSEIDAARRVLAALDADLKARSDGSTEEVRR